MAKRDKPLSVVSALLGAAGNCFCEFPNVRENSNQGVQFMELHEPYLQASFQVRYDEGNTADHTHKYAKVIKASGRKGRVFTASYTVASLNGLVNMN